jgi:hypothetical protein
MDGDIFPAQNVSDDGLDSDFGEESSPVDGGGDDFGGSSGSEDGGPDDFGRTILSH